MSASVRPLGGSLLIISVSALHLSTTYRTFSLVRVSVVDTERFAPVWDLVQTFVGIFKRKRSIYLFIYLNPHTHWQY